jgi:hypothetical protein
VCAESNAYAYSYGNYDGKPNAEAYAYTKTASHTTAAPNSGASTVSVGAIRSFLRGLAK